MPGTGTLRRSSGPARKKAIVGKSLVEAKRFQRPAFVFLALAITGYSSWLGGGQFQVVQRSLVLFSQRHHVEVTVGLKPSFMDLDGEGPDQP